MAQSEVTQAQHDQRLLQQLASGESSAFWELWLGCKDRLYRICLHFAGNSQQDAEDILSEVMLKAFEKLPSHACNIRDFKCWMAKFARNTCIDVVRKRRREQMQVCELETEPAMHSVQGSPPTWKGEVSVTALLEKLSPCQLAAFICRFIQEKEYPEIARELKIPATAARKRVQRAREILRAHWRDAGVETHV